MTGSSAGTSKPKRRLASADFSPGGHAATPRTAPSRRLLKNLQAPRRRYRLADSTPPAREPPAPWLRAFGDRRPLSCPPPPQHCAGQHGAARRLALRQGLPCRGLPADSLRETATPAKVKGRPRGTRPAGGSKSEIRQPAAPEAARSPWPMFARCARLHQGRSGVNAPLCYAFNITAHYPKSGQSLRRLRFVARPLARPAGSGNGLLCLAPLRGQLR